MAHPEIGPGDGVSADDLNEVLLHPLYEGVVQSVSPPTRVLYLGRTSTGDLIEVTAIECDDGTEVAIHAQTMHSGYEELLDLGVNDG